MFCLLTNTFGLSYKPNFCGFKKNLQDNTNYCRLHMIKASETTKAEIEPRSFRIAPSRFFVIGIWQADRHIKSKTPLKFCNFGLNFVSDFAPVRNARHFTSCNILSIDNISLKNLL